MTAWMIWAVVTTGLFAVAAHLLEPMLRARRRQARWLWVAAIAASLALQAWSLVEVRRPGPERVDDGAAVTTASAPSGVQVSIEELLTAPALERADPYAGALWLLASAMLLTGLLGGLWRLHRRASRWPRQRVGSCDVLVSEDFGPALVGVISPQVVLPRALLAQPAEALRLVCLHETEHRAAHDTWVLAAGALLGAAMPWNAALWWQLRRLHAAVELDCDQRVLDAGIPATRYARLLLGIGTGVEPLGVPVPALLQSSPPLERRLNMMITGVRRRGRIATLATVAGAVLGVAAACGAPAPTTPPTAPPAAPPTAEPAAEPTAPPPPAPTNEPAAAPPAAPPAAPTLERTLPEIRLESLGVGEPLFLIDGVEVDRSALSSLDPGDIESIEVIKGPAAVRLHGDSAAGGVVQITMKPR